MKLFTVLAVATASISTVSVAQTERDLDSHEHGAAILNVAIDAPAVFLELETPWNNLVGFEHEPGTDDQQALVDQALATLRQPDELFSFNGGGCSAGEISIESAMSGSDHSEEAHEGESDHDDAHEEEHDYGHKEEHDDGHEEAHDDAHEGEHEEGHEEEHDDGHKEEHDDHDDGHGHDGAEPETHTTAMVTYTYHCDNAASLKSIDVKLFNVWSGFDDLDVQFIGPGGQGLAELTPDRIVLDLAPVQ